MTLTLAIALIIITVILICKIVQKIEKEQYEDWNDFRTQNKDLFTWDNPSWSSIKKRPTKTSWSSDQKQSYIDEMRTRYLTYHSSSHEPTKDDIRKKQ